MIFTVGQNRGRFPNLNSSLGWFLALILFGLYCNELGLIGDLKGRLMEEGRKVTGSDDLEGFFANEEYIEENLEGLDQGDSRLIKYVRNRFLSPPSKRPYNLKHGAQNSEFKAWMATSFKNKNEGVYIEAGASDGGRDSSRTLQLEQNQNWTGILIECNPLVYPYLLQTHRKAWIATVCISNTQFPNTINFTYPPWWTYSGRVGEPWKIPGKPGNWTSLEVQAIPLYTILAAAGLNQIDLFVFDVEGSEFKILQHFPFHLISIKTILMEVYFLSELERKELIGFMETKGYKLETEFPMDYVFVQKNIEN